MAGTLLPCDPVTGRAGALPGSDTILPVLGRDFRLLVATGDTTEGARSLLREFGLLQHFDAVYGDLHGPVGKPYGAILGRVGADPRCSLAIGDRLRADLPADTDEVVTVLVNQDGDRVSAGLVAALVWRLRGQAEEFPAAFDALLAGAEPTPAVVGPWQGGAVVKAGWAHGEAAASLRVYRHPALAGDRRVIVF
ncbi:MAG: HAD family hydrolase [Krumholzibacteria bacterium]|nr:HAD family hydrolase [Candidatus Krumholzibacteria bacterium]